MDTTKIITEGRPREKGERAKQLRRLSTDAEKLLWENLRSNRLGGLHFRRQQVIDGFIVDFYCHAAGLIVEADGDVHNQLKEKDAERDAILTSRGLQILHFSNAHIENELEGVLAEILATAHQRISRGTAS